MLPLLVHGILLRGMVLYKYDLTYLLNLGLELGLGLGLYSYDTSVKNTAFRLFFHQCLPRTANETDNNATHIVYIVNPGLS